MPRGWAYILVVDGYLCGAECAARRRGGVCTVITKFAKKLFEIIRPDRVHHGHHGHLVSYCMIKSDIIRVFGVKVIRFVSVLSIYSPE